MTSSTQFPYTAAGNAQPIFYKPSPEIVRSEIHDFANKAGSLANQILSQNNASNYAGPIVVRDHHYYSNPFWMSSFFHPSPQVIVINDNGSSTQRGRTTKNESKRNDDHQVAWLIAAGAATLVSGILIYTLGSAISAYSDASQELGDTQNFKHKLSIYQHTADEQQQGLVYEASKTADLKERICKRIKNSALTNIVLRTGALASGIALTTGAVFNSGILKNYSGIASEAVLSLAKQTPILLTAGAVVGLVSVGGLLFKGGFDSSDKANFRDAETLKNSVHNLKQR